MKKLLRSNLTALTAVLLASGSAAFGSILGTAGDYTVLGGTAITSTDTLGTVLRNGNVGLSPAATTNITGFPPAVIENGAIIPTGAVTAQARQDLIKAQTGLAAMPSNVNLGTTDLAGLILPPGVYTFGAAANLTGTVILDGQGNNNAFWVFQIGTTLTTALGSSVTIVNPGSNGGADYGIFWNCGSAINIGANNEISGIYLSGTSITFGVNSTRGGRALALAGVSLDNNQFDALGGPGGSDYSGGLEFDENGNVIALRATSPDTTLVASTEYSFEYFGKRKRKTRSSKIVLKGSATELVTKIEYRTKGSQWRSARLRNNGKWKLRIRRLDSGKNKILLRARNAAGNSSRKQRIIVIRG